MGGIRRQRGGTRQAEALPGLAAQPMRERRPRLAYKALLFRHPSGVCEPPKGLKERHVGYRHAPHVGGSNPRSNSSNRGPPETVACSQPVQPLHFIYPPTLCWAAMRVPSFVRRVSFFRAVLCMSNDTNLRAPIQMVSQERGSRQGVGRGQNMALRQVAGRPGLWAGRGGCPCGRGGGGGPPRAERRGPP
jgi:hypothetical protein